MASSRISVVTGASRGLGLEFVTQLSINPSNLVFALARNPGSAPKLQGLAQSRQNVILVKADTIDDEGIDVLIANAGIATARGEVRDIEQLWEESFSTRPYDDFTELFNVNVVGSIRTVNTFLPLVKKGNEKKIIMVSSVSGSLSVNSIDNPFDRNGNGFVGPYCVSKAALNMAARKYAVEFHKDGIIVIAIQPGYIKTDLPGTNAASLEAPEAIKKAVNRLDSLLLSDSGRFINMQEDKDIPF
ncbi:NAD(P)-binding protein [Atractiella rhizophila]|nr:NAD(P)-binding protein [Atractiella rhizophila]